MKYKTKKKIQNTFKKKDVKIISGALAATLTVTGMGLIGCAIYDSKVDHMREACPFNKVLGVEHQLNKINKSSFVTSSYEHLIVEETKTIVVPAGRYTDGTGKTQYIVPNGYTLDGTDAYKEEVVKTDEGDYIVIGVKEKFKDGELIDKKDLDNCTLIKIK